MCKTISVSEKTKNKNKKSPQTLSPQTPKYLKYLSFSFFPLGNTEKWLGFFPKF